MHPIERLRYVARFEGAEPGEVAAEAGYALAAVAAQDPAGLVPACRRLVDRHGASGPMWWLAARVLASHDPAAVARESADALADLSVVEVLTRCIPDDATVAVIGWPPASTMALRRRGDLEVLAIDGGGLGSDLARRLSGDGVAVAAVSDAGAACAAMVAGIVLVEAVAAGPSGLLAGIGSHGAAAVASHAGVPVWGVFAPGRVLPGALWDALLSRLDEGGSEPWDREVELVPAGLLTAAVSGEAAGGPQPVTSILSGSDAPAAAELLRMAR